jgi:hypothetical protein
MTRLLRGAHDIADKAARTFGAAMTGPDAARPDPDLIRHAWPCRGIFAISAGQALRRLNLLANCHRATAARNAKAPKNANPTNHMRPTAVGAFILQSVAGV